jgi:hypothetical protein
MSLIRGNMVSDRVDSGPGTLNRVIMNNECNVVHNPNIKSKTGRNPHHPESSLLKGKVMCSSIARMLFTNTMCRDILCCL